MYNANPSTIPGNINGDKKIALKKLTPGNLNRVMKIAAIVPSKVEITIVIKANPKLYKNAFNNTSLLKNA